MGMTIIGARQFFAIGGGGGGGGELFAQKILASCPKFLRNSRKETRVIPCTNISLHMK